MYKFKVGDKVRIKDKTGFTYGISEETLKEMVKEKNVWTIKSIEKENQKNFYKLNEDIHGFFINEDMLEKANYTYEDLKKAPIGTKVTFEDGEVLVKLEKGHFENTAELIYIQYLENFKDNDHGKIIKIEEPTYATVYEHKGEILDEAEKRYLRGVIRPFRDKIKSIIKYGNSLKQNYIVIYFKNGSGIVFPAFKEDTMYKGMKVDKEYTLKELEL